MRTIEVRFSKPFNGWTAFDAPGVEPTFPDPSGKQNAISYARGRFGGSRGEIHVYDETGDAIVERIAVDGGSGYGQPARGEHINTQAPAPLLP